MTAAQVVVKPRRDYGFATVAALAGNQEPTNISRPDADGRVTFAFNPPLPDSVAAEVWECLDSTDETDRAKRATLRADRDALPANDPLRRLYCYVLGD